MINNSDQRFREEDEFENNSILTFNTRKAIEKYSNSTVDVLFPSRNVTLVDSLKLIEFKKENENVIQKQENKMEYHRREEANQFNRKLEKQQDLSSIMEEVQAEQTHSPKLIFSDQNQSQNFPQQQILQEADNEQNKNQLNLGDYDPWELLTLFQKRFGSQNNQPALKNVEKQQLQLDNKVQAKPKRKNEDFSNMQQSQQLPNQIENYDDTQCPYCGEEIVRDFMADHLQDCLIYQEDQFKQLENVIECSIFNKTQMQSFHSDCLNDWLAKKNECPVCRKQL